MALSAAAAAAPTCQVARCLVDAPRLSLTSVQLGQVVIAVLAVSTVGGEYSTGMIRTTMTALPHRITVLAAKAATVTVLTLASPKWSPTQPGNGTYNRSRR